MTDSGQLLLAGCGDIGLRIARLWPQRSAVTGMTRSASALRELEALNILACCCDLDSTGPITFPAALDLERTHIVYLAPPFTGGPEDLRLKKFLAALPRAPASFSYCSTSGVYGDCKGAWVDETAPVVPVTERAKRRVWAENHVLNWQRLARARAMILRVPGIYGPGRLPLDKLRSGLPLIRPQESPWTNLIQAEDLARVFIACIRRGTGGAIYNVAGGDPVSGTDYYLTVARAAELPIPGFIGMEAAQRIYSAERLSFINESRRLNVDKMRRELQPDLHYTNLETGVRASLARSTTG
jgi:nucleoside-diphosphate-sugar epimerase